MALLEDFSGEPWPAEGRALGEIVEYLVGPGLWAYLLDHIGDERYPQSGRRQCSLFRLGDDFRNSTDQLRNAVDCCQPLLDAWNSGAIVARARVGGPLEPLTEIPPPKVGYTVTVSSLLHSTIVQQASLGEYKFYYDARFWPTSKSPRKTKIGMKEILQELIAEFPFPRDDYGWKKKWAERAADAINKRPGQRQTDAKRVAARMYDYKLWPK